LWGADTVDGVPEPIGTVTPTRRRADALRSIELIIDAARSVLGERPDASMGDLAAAAGLTRQTVYAHFPSRGALIAAVFNSVVAEALAAIEDANLDALAPPLALRRLLDISDQLVRRYPFMLDPTVARIGASAGDDPHDPFTACLERLTRRGQRSGDFDRGLPARWLVSATFSLSHVAAEQVVAGRLTQSKAAKLLKLSVSRLYGLAPTEAPKRER
jgi:AcrR family transcriptional regulator